jgi:hypothetical protein
MSGVLNLDKSDVGYCTDGEYYDIFDYWWYGGESYGDWYFDFTMKGPAICVSYEQICLGNLMLENDIVPEVTIQNPPDNPNPSDNTFDSNPPFLSDSTINANAILYPSGNTSNISWYTTAASGGVTDESPGDRIGPQYSFKPNPPAHPAYVGSIDCDHPGNGSCSRSAALAYSINCSYSGSNQSALARIAQDQRDIIRQEYKNHSISIPARTDFHPPEGATNYSVATILHFTSYSVILGQPAQLAQQVRDNFNSLLHDDVQNIQVGTTGLSATDVVVSPGTTIETIGDLLDTPACNGAPNPNTCDDYVLSGRIVAGPNGIAETYAVTAATNFDVILSSAWRNPERNEAWSGTLNSAHQYGNAVDLKPGSVPGKTSAQLNCILKTAGSQVPGANAIAEHGPTVVACTAANVNHIHVEK